MHPDYSTRSIVNGPDIPSRSADRKPRFMQRCSIRPTSEWHHINRRCSHLGLDSLLNRTLDAIVIITEAQIVDNADRNGTRQLMLHEY